MNQDIFEGKCKEMRSQIKVGGANSPTMVWKGRDSNTDQLVGLLQQKYGETLCSCRRGIQSADKGSERGNS